jgi:hypothetical protein
VFGIFKRFGDQRMRISRIVSARIAEADNGPLTRRVYDIEPNEVRMFVHRPNLPSHRPLHCSLAPELPCLLHNLEK